MTEDNVTCQYVGTDGKGIDSEYEEHGTVACEADAEIVIRPSSGGMSDIRSILGKQKVCVEHGRWLISDETERDWEQCGELY